MTTQQYPQQHQQQHPQQHPQQQQFMRQSQQPHATTNIATQPATQQPTFVPNSSRQPGPVSAQQAQYMTMTRAAKLYRPESGFMSPNSLDRNLEESFVGNACKLDKAITSSPPDVVRRVIREHWTKCLSGSLYHQAFLFNISLSAVQDYARPSVLGFGQKMVKICINEIAQHLDAEIIDGVADQILRKASPTFLDKAMAERLKTIESRDLLNMLARAERLGYTADDILDDNTEEEDRTFMMDLDVEIVATNVVSHKAPNPTTMTTGRETGEKIMDQLSNALGLIPTAGSDSVTDTSTATAKRAALAEPSRLAPPPPTSADSSLYQIRFAQGKSETEGFNPDISCQYCKMIFPSQKARYIHVSEQACLKERDPAYAFGCRFCGITFLTAHLLQLHAENKVCGDNSLLGQSTAYPNGIKFPNRMCTPCVIRKEVPKSHNSSNHNTAPSNGATPRNSSYGQASLPRGPTSVPISVSVPVPASASVTAPASASASASASAPASAPTSTSTPTTIQRKVTASVDLTSPEASTRSTPQIPALNTPKASGAVSQSTPQASTKANANPLAHLTQEQVDRMELETQKIHVNYGSKIDQAMAADDKSKANSLCNSMVDDISLVRKKYSVETPKEKKLSLIGAILSPDVTTTPKKNTPEAQSREVASSHKKRVWTSTITEDTVGSSGTSRVESRKTTPESGVAARSPAVGNIGPTKTSTPLPRDQVKRPGTLSVEMNDNAREERLRKVSRTPGRDHVTANRSTGPAAAAPGASTTDRWNTRVVPSVVRELQTTMYISSSDDSDSDDSIPARLPRPVLR
ncbi:uncharacterized protein BROUX77_000336 [Berkeleyomyces rouxiae]|uniref:uncharacterized protein n=1 Tax=Berkeleyomyces rouxiae TaxID=2035830 RepID=UPI003B78B0CE